LTRSFETFWTDDLARRCGVLEIRGRAGHDSRTEHDITGLHYDSRQVTAGSLYFALKGLHVDGHDFIPEAVAGGARVVVHEGELPEYRRGVVYVRVKDSRFAMSPVADAFYGRPSRRLTVIGVTGTEGKSTTVYLIFQLLRALGKKAGFISTVQYSLDGTERDNPEHQTTPEAPVVHQRLADMLGNGLEYAVLEASSHGLSPKTNRLGDVRFDAAVMTNVAHEHLEFHGTWEQYRDDKANLFRAAQRLCVVNADDLSADYFSNAARTPVRSFSVHGAEADLSIRHITPHGAGSRYDAYWRGSGSNAPYPITDNLPGAFNAGNVAAALLIVSGLLDAPPCAVIPLVPRLKPVRGRMTSVDCGQDFEVLIDYAHTPSSFQIVFPSLRARLGSGGRLIAVFGSGGERDTQKRPIQGEIASRWADIIILTDEDPRGEEPLAILREIAAGIYAGGQGGAWKEGENLFLIPNRPQAVACAVGLAGKGDLVVLLGKGHENSIIHKDRTDRYDEASCVREALRSVL
jgi:UDP-N-acetylmuramoyl-L-alanyl-D-glutamate--2,6-diaminopimelate ligase